MEAPQQFGPAGIYSNPRRLGGGRYGQVFRYSEVNGPDVAVKFIVGDRDSLDRSGREVINLARCYALVGVVSIKDHGRTEVTGRDEYGNPEALGALYVVMELAPGGSLLDQIKRHHQGLPPATIDRLADQLIAAVKGVHALEIVHRDIKSANVLVAHEDPNDPVCRFQVSDFGQSKPRDEHTYVGGGTLSYMPAEQYSQKQRPANDVWALGVVLFEAATGTLSGTLAPEGLLGPELPRRIRDEILTRLDQVEASRHRALIRGLLTVRPGPRERFFIGVKPFGTRPAPRRDPGTMETARDGKNTGEGRRGARPVFVGGGAVGTIAVIGAWIAWGPALGTGTPSAKASTTTPAASDGQRTSPDPDITTPRATSPRATTPQAAVMTETDRKLVRFASAATGMTLDASGDRRLVCTPSSDRPTGATGRIQCDVSGRTVTYTSFDTAEHVKAAFYRLRTGSAFASYSTYCGSKNESYPGTWSGGNFAICKQDSADGTQAAIIWTYATAQVAATVRDDGARLPALYQLWRYRVANDKPAVLKALG